MIESIVKKIMMTGINKYANIYGVSNENVQIKVTINSEGMLVYTMCKNFKDVEEVSFLQIMNKKLDLLGYESISTPSLGRALQIFAEEYKVDIENSSCFIMKHKDTIGLAFYDKFKNLKNILLAKQIEELGF